MTTEAEAVVAAIEANTAEIKRLADCCSVLLLATAADTNRLTLAGVEKQRVEQAVLGLTMKIMADNGAPPDAN